MCNLCIESDKLNDKGFLCVYDIIKDEYSHGKLTTYDDDYMMYAYFFQLSSISKRKLKQKDIQIHAEYIQPYQYQHMQKLVL